MKSSEFVLSNIVSFSFGNYMWEVDKPKKQIPKWQLSLASSLRERLPFLTTKRRMVFFGVEDQSNLPSHIPLYGGIIHKLFNSSVWMEMSKKTCEEMIAHLETYDLTEAAARDKQEEMFADQLELLEDMYEE